MRMQKPILVAASVLLAVGTVLVFVAFDSHSHSVSDTIRPFIFTMTPIWAAFVLAIWVVRRSEARQRERR